MTPLARKIALQLTLPLKRRTFIDQGGVLKLMSDIHCFDCSAIYALAGELGAQVWMMSKPVDKIAFLPAPKTWIEHTTPRGRNGFLIVDHGDFWRVYSCASEGGKTWSMHATLDLDLNQRLTPERAVRIHNISKDEANAPNFPMDRDDFIYGLATHLVGLLAMINTPRIVGRTTHVLNRTLAKKFDRLAAGKFPLNAWTTIRLSINPKPNREPQTREAYLSGRRAQYFVRTHLRIRLGRLELVKHHYRGNPALGMVQSRYLLTK